MLTETEITEALRVCYDPELQINIVDLCRIHSIGIEPDTEAPGTEPRTSVRVHLLPWSDEADPMLAALVTNRLLGIPEISRAETTVVEAPPWTPDRMTLAARRERSKQQGLIQLGGN